MPEFEFIIEQKETIWRKNFATIEAENEEEAIKMMKEYAKDFRYDDVHDSEFIYETAEDLSYEENSNQPTREIRYNNSFLVDNTPIEIKRDKKINSILNEKD